MRRGFTMLELLFAVGLLGTLALTLLGVFLSGIRLTTQNRESLQSARIAQQVLESLNDRSLDFPTGTRTFDGGQNDPTLNGFPPAPYPRVQLDNQDYVIRLRSEPVTGRSELYSVSVEVSWRDGSHASRLQTYFRRD